MIYRTRIAVARALLAGQPGTRRMRIALAKVHPDGSVWPVTWLGGLRGM